MVRVNHQSFSPSRTIKDGYAGASFAPSSDKALTISCVPYQIKFNLIPMKSKLEEELDKVKTELDRERIKNQAIHEFLKDKGLRI